MKKSEIEEGGEYLWEHIDPQSGETVREKVKVTSETVEGFSASRVVCAGSPDEARNKEFPPITEYDYFVEIETASGEKTKVKCGELRRMQEG